MKRFWEEVTLEPAGSGWSVALDGRPIRTVGGNPQVVPTRQLAELLAEEWRGQGETIDPASLPLRDMADYAIDMVAPDRAAAATKLLRFAETDTLCYRADPEDPLFRRQQELWEPLLTAHEARHGVRLERVSGVVPRAQPAGTLDRLRSEVERLDPFRLAALEATASLTASLCIGMAALERGADLDALWGAANLEEEWQAARWGSDAEADARLAMRREEFNRAARFAQAAAQPD